MEGYIYRLLRLGFSMAEAFEKYDDYMSKSGVDELEKYISDLEADLYVD